VCHRMDRSQRPMGSKLPARTMPRAVGNRWPRVAAPALERARSSTGSRHASPRTMYPTFAELTPNTDACRARHSATSRRSRGSCNASTCPSRRGTCECRRPLLIRGCATHTNRSEMSRPHSGQSTYGGSLAPQSGQKDASGRPPRSVLQEGMCGGVVAVGVLRAVGLRVHLRPGPGSVMMPPLTIPCRRYGSARLILPTC
jgi:hypothetical protein